MNRKVWVWVLSIGLLAVGVALVTTARLGAQELPKTTQDSLASLKDSFRGMLLGPDNPCLLEDEVTRNAGTIHSILTYANSSASAREALSSYLISDLSDFSSRFSPETELDEEAVGKGTYEKGEEPWYGLTVDAYLLLEMASSARSASFTKEALGSVCTTQQSLVNFFDALRKVLAPPDAPGPPEQGEECPPRQYGSTPGAELAWCCEQFLMEGYSSGAFLDIPEAQAVVSDYKLWRDKALAKRGLEESLPVDCAGVTMEYARKLADALP